MQPKGEFFAIKTYPISSPAANVLKQQMLAVGGECAVSRQVITCSAEAAPVILLGTRRQFARLIEELEPQYFGLAKLRQDLMDFIQRLNNEGPVGIGDRVFDLDAKTYIMGILNVTPDSFYDGGRYSSMDAAVEHALQMEAEGADIIDVGGESTRPGASGVSQAEEMQRVVPLIEKLRQRCSVPISVDTYKSAVAQAALEAGAQVVNDISGLRFDAQLAATVARYKATIVVMHIQGTPRDMQINPHYDNLIDEILQYLETSVTLALQAGVDTDRIIVDPGIGFGKSLEDNYTILKYLKEFKSLGYPLLVGPSRKSFIGKVLDLPPEERLEGTLAAVSVAALNGANFVRVHDVKAAMRALKIVDTIKKAG